MQNRKLKNTIVLKQIPSNLIEEAIIVLKPNIKIRKKEYIDTNNINKNDTFNNNYIVKEAENIISDYINKSNERNKIENYKKRFKKYKFLKILNILLVIALVSLIIFK